MDLDYSLYLVTDRNLTNGRDLINVIKEAVTGGVSVVQLREKDCSSRDFYNIALEVKNFLKTLNIPLIINDRLDIALAVNAQGLHIGQSDIPYQVARRIMGKGAIIGLSVETIQDAIDAEKLDVDYLGISPVFSTNTKLDIAKPLGLEGIKKIKSLSSHKLVGIGGINIDNVEKLFEAGVDGVAVVSAICSADSPEAASREFTNKINKFKRI